MLSLFVRAQQAVPALIFLMVLGIMISSHSPWSDVAALGTIGTLVAGIPIVRWLWRRHLLRKEGARIAAALGGQGRFGGDAYEIRSETFIASMTSPVSPTGKNKNLVVSVIGASKNLALTVTHEDADTNREVGKGRAMDLQLGDPVVDPMLAIEGASVEGVRGTLSDERVKWPLRAVAGNESLHISVRDGLVRVRCVGHEANEELVRLALGLAHASHDHATVPLTEDGTWQQLHAIEEARDERIQRLKAWMSQSLTAFIAVMCVIKVTSGTTMKMNFGPIEILGLALGAVGLPRYTADLLGTICVAWVGFAIPGVVRYAALGHGRMQTGIHPAWSFLFAPITLLCLGATYQAEQATAASAAAARAATIVKTPAKPAPKPTSKPAAKPSSALPQPVVVVLADAGPRGQADAHGVDGSAAGRAR